MAQECRFEDLQPTNVRCPECRRGVFEPARGRFGPIWRCSNRPACKFSLTARPIGKKCKLCGAPMVEGTKTIPDRCSDRECPNRNPHKLKRELAPAQRKPAASRRRA